MDIFREYYAGITFDDPLIIAAMIALVVVWCGLAIFRRRRFGGSSQIYQSLTEKGVE